MSLLEEQVDPEVLASVGPKLQVRVSVPESVVAKRSRIGRPSGTVDHIEVTALVDIGANRTAISKRLVAKLGLTEFAKASVSGVNRTENTRVL